MNGFRLKKQQSFNSHLLTPVEMKSQGEVPTSSNISTTPAGVYEVCIDALSQGFIGGLL